MLNNKDRKCPFTEEIVSYIYGELDGAAGGKFESHLADCMVCTDDFAAISNARFSVYEWQKEEFAHLQTPSFVIPYKTESVTEPAFGFFAGLRALLSVGNLAATAAALLIAVALGVWAMNYFNGGDSPIAANIAPIETNKPDQISLPTPVDPTPERKDVITASEKPSASSQRQFRPQRAAAKIEPQRKQATQPKAPTLSNFEDNADRSLRLTDLIDGIGG